MVSGKYGTVSYWLGFLETKFMLMQLMCKLLHGASQRKIEAWELISTNILRNYSGPVDIWFSILYAVRLSDGLHCFLNEQPRKSYVAMAQHMSQWVWCFIVQVPKAFRIIFQLYFCERT